MPDSPDKLSQFWQELKRRKVVRVITVYAAAAFVILEVVSIIVDPLKLPEWTLPMIIVLLCIGFVIAVILSWIYDMTPKGIEKTRPSTETGKEAQETPSRLLAWKIATFISAFVIVGLVVIHILRSTERSRDIQTMEKSIAVLPFENWSYEDEYSHLGNGMANEIITELYKIREFRVLSHTSTLQYNGSKKTIPVIGQELGVNYIIEGTVERQENRVNIHVQVIRVKNETHIWAKEYEGDWNDVFQIEDDIAFSVAEELKAVLSENEIESIEKIPTDHLEAYNLYLRANDFYYRGFSKQDLSVAVNMYERAIILDPNFALAYTMLARSHLMQYWLHHDRSTDRITESKRAIDAAFSIDPDLVEAHAALGTYYYLGFLDYSKALEHFKIALESDPDNAEYIYQIALVNRRMGSWEKAKEGFVKAYNKEPSSAITAYVASRTFWLMNEYSKALYYIDLAINLDPDLISAHNHKINLYLKWEGNTKNARKILEEASLMIDPSTESWFINSKLALDILDGNYQHAIDLLYTTNSEPLQSQFSYYPKSMLFAIVYDLLKDSEKADHYYDTARIHLESKLLEFPEDSRLYGSLGICYAGLGQKEQAVIAGEKAVELLPVSKEAFRGVYRLGELAWIYVMVGEYDQALEKLDTLLSVPGNLSAQLLQLDPIWMPLWDHPGFMQLIDKHSEK